MENPGALDPAGEINKARRDFLIHMYDQLFNDINTHILVVWQSVGALVGAFAVFALVEKQVIPLDLAASLIVLISAWLIAHLYDASYWYNRNLVMIANIERQFLGQADLKEIHYYFGKHRSKGSMIMHLKIQYWLAVGIVSIVLLLHLYVRVLPGIGEHWNRFEPLRCLPYFVALLAVIGLFNLRSGREAAYEEFLRNSPGREVDTTGVSYGTGHPTKSQDSRPSSD